MDDIEIGMDTTDVEQYFDKITPWIHHEWEWWTNYRCNEVNETIFINKTIANDFTEDLCQHYCQNLAASPNIMAALNGENRLCC